MTQITQEQRDALQSEGWTEEEAAAFAQAIAAFGENLPPHQRAAFVAILAAAGAAAGGDVQGHVFQSGGQPPTMRTIAQPSMTNRAPPAIIAVLIGMLLPAVQKVRE